MNFHYVSIRAWKDPAQKWYDLPYLVTDDAIVVVLESWLEKWHKASELLARSSKSTTKQKKEEARLKME